MRKVNRASMSDAQKFSLVRCEAIYTGIALIGLIIFWLIAGFGTASSEIKIFHLPLWALLGSVGVWFVAILISAVLSKVLFKDIDLGGDDNGK
ncbi:MAG: YhdT family protein [Selenomonadaceae bacterium]|nr:YhdT family protein [Selenomonadaceae bacterium]